ncbi:unnamed protein product, partial [Pleuronectes platessa]
PSLVPGFTPGFSHNALRSPSRGDPAASAPSCPNPWLLGRRRAVYPGRPRPGFSPRLWPLTFTFPRSIVTAPSTCCTAFFLCLPRVRKVPGFPSSTMKIQTRRQGRARPGRARPFGVFAPAHLMSLPLSRDKLLIQTEDGGKYRILRS